MLDIGVSSWNHLFHIETGLLHPTFASFERKGIKPSDRFNKLYAEFKEKVRIKFLIVVVQKPWFVTSALQ